MIVNDDAGNDEDDSTYLMLIMIWSCNEGDDDTIVWLTWSFNNNNEDGDNGEDDDNGDRL